MLGNFLSCVKGVKDPFEAQEGRWDFPRDATAKKGLHLTLMGESPDFAPVAEGGLGFLSSYHGVHRNPLVLPQGSQVSIRVAGGVWDCSGVTAGESGLHSH